MKTKGRDRLSLAIVDADVSLCRTFAGWVGRTRDVDCAGICPSGESALDALPAKKPDLVLLEVNLPGLNGIASLGRLKPRLPGTSFVFYTCSTDPDHLFAALAAGAAGYFLKGIPLEKLLAGMKKKYSGPGIQDLSRTGAARKVLEYFHQFALPPDAPGFPRRQQDVLDLMLRGWCTPQIAEALALTDSTVETHTRRIFKKLGVHSRAQAMAKFNETRSLKVAAADPAGATSTVPAGQNGGLALKLPPLRPLRSFPGKVPVVPFARLKAGFQPAGGPVAPDGRYCPDASDPDPGARPACRRHNFGPADVRFWVSTVHDHLKHYHQHKPNSFRTDNI